MKEKQCEKDNSVKEKQCEKMITGAKLLMILHKEQRLEDSLVRVVNNLQFGKD